MALRDTLITLLDSTLDTEAAKQPETGLTALYNAATGEVRIRSWRENTVGIDVVISIPAALANNWENTWNEIKEATVRETARRRAAR